MADETDPQAKKRKLGEDTPGSSNQPLTLNPAESQIVAQEKPPSNQGGGTSAMDVDEPEEYLKPIFSRISAVVSPNLIAKLKKASILGHRRPSDERILEPRYYTLNVANFRTAISAVLKSALEKKYSDMFRSMNKTNTKEIDVIVPLAVDACMIALYAKLRTIHKAYSQYSSRFSTPPSYTKDLELPLPIAEAISQVGVFEMTCSDKCYLVVPVIPEGTKHECRASDEWHSFKYESCIQIFKDCGIPCKSINSREKTGSAWWTYKMSLINDSFDATMIFAPRHYTDHSMTIALMFIYLDPTKKTILPIVQSLNDDLDYGKFAQNLIPGFQRLAFYALCGMPAEEWNVGTSVV